MRSTTAIFGAVFLLFPAVVAAQSLPLEVTAPADGALLNDTTPTFAGTTQAAAEVTVSVGSTPFTVIAGDGGGWTIEAPNELDDGAYTATVSATDGVETAVDVMVDFTIDATPPALVLIEPIEGTFIEPTTTVSGNTDPGAQIEVFVDGVLVGTTESADGPWEVMIPEDGEISAGEHTLTVSAIDEAQNVSTLSIVVAVMAPPDLTDTDGDGLTDEIERTLGTDVDSVDTDGDGLSDFDEFEEHKTNPLAADTDNDGVNDDVELDAGMNPRLQDTDGGGVFDGVELDNATDPTDPEDDYPAPRETAGNGCSTAAGASPTWLLLFALLLFKRVRRR